MSRALFFISISGITMILILYIFLLNKLLKAGKLPWEKLIIAVLIPVTAGMAYLGCRDYVQLKADNQKNIYLAYKCLNSGSYEEAKDRVEAIKDVAAAGTHLVEIKALAAILSGNFKAAQIEISKYSIQNALKPEEKARLAELMKLTDIDSEQQEQLKAEIQSKAMQIMADSSREIVHDGKTAAKLDMIFSIEQRLRSGDMSEVLKEDVYRLSLEDRNDIDIKKLEAGMHLLFGNYNEAEDIIRDIIRYENTIENKFALTDLVAQKARESINSGSYTNSSMSYGNDTIADNEVQSMLGRVQKKRADMDKLSVRMNEAKSEKSRYKVKLQIEKIQKEINDLEKSIAIIPVKRAINYIKFLKPVWSKDAYLYDLQLAKLYYAADDKDNAKKYLEKALSEADETSDGSVVKASLLKVKKIYAQGTVTDEVLLVSEITKLVSNLGLSYILPRNGNLSQEYVNFIASHVKYSKSEIYVSEIDTGRYPDITAFVSVGSEKRGILGNMADFTQKDFQIIDTKVKISDFEVQRIDNKNTDISLVFDKSGSMEGRPITDAKLAGIDFIRKIGNSRRISIVSFSFDGALECSLTGDKNTLENAITGINIGGGTNIAGGLNQAIESLKSSMERRAIILLSDGNDENAAAGEMDKAIAAAAALGIPVYTVGFGEVNDAYLGNISQSTVGKFVKADNSAELGDIYSILRKFIVNNYVVRYQVGENSDIKERNLYVKLKSTSDEGSRDYSPATGD